MSTLLAGRAARPTAATALAPSEGWPAPPGGWPGPLQQTQYFVAVSRGWLVVPLSQLGDEPCGRHVFVVGVRNGSAPCSVGRADEYWLSVNGSSFEGKVM